MKKLFILGLCCAIFNQSVFSQLDTKHLYEGVWTEKDNGISALKWTFHSAGKFNQIAFWNNGVEIGNTVSCGNIVYDNTTNTLNFTYEKYALTTNDKLDSGKSDKQMQWKIKSITENEIVINRPVNTELEKQLKSYDGKNVDIVLRRLVKLPY